MPLGKRRKFIDESVDQWKQNKESIGLPSIFNLRNQERLEFEFTDEDLVEIPIELELESTFEKYHTVIGSSPAPNETLSRSFINLVIFSCVLEERMLINKPKKKAQPQTSSSFAPPVTPPRMIPESPASTSRQDICVYFETEIRQAIKFQGKDYMLSSIADYSLGYNNAGRLFMGSLQMVLIITSGVLTITPTGDIFERRLRLEQKFPQEVHILNFSIHHTGGHADHPRPHRLLNQKNSGNISSASITRSLTSERYHFGKIFLQQKTTQRLTLSKFQALAGWRRRIEPADDEIGVKDER